MSVSVSTCALRLPSELIETCALTSGSCSMWAVCNCLLLEHKGCRSEIIKYSEASWHREDAREMGTREGNIGPAISAVTAVVRSWDSFFFSLSKSVTLGVLEFTPKLLFTLCYGGVGFSCISATEYFL